MPEFEAKLMNQFDMIKNFKNKNMDFDLQTCGYDLAFSYMSS